MHKINVYKKSQAHAKILQVSPLKTNTKEMGKAQYIY